MPTTQYFVICRHKIGDKGIEVGWKSKARPTRFSAETLVKMLESPPEPCPGPHEIKEELVESVNGHN